MRPVEILRFGSGLGAYVAGVAIPAIGVPVGLGSLAAQLGVKISPEIPGWWVVSVAASLVVLITVAPRLVERIIDRLPEHDPPDSLVTRVEDRADQRNIDPPRLRVVEVDAPTMCAYRSIRGKTTLVVSRRVPQMASEEALESVIDHMLVRGRQPHLLVTTVVLPLVLAVETATLVGVGLVARRQVSEPSTRARRGWGPQHLGRHAETGRQIPSAIWVGLGVSLLAVTAPLWLCTAVGDRFVISLSRRLADREVARDGNGESLAAFLTATRDADGRGDWPPGLDRLSLLTLAAGKTRSFRGTDRNEERVRVARLLTNRV